MTSLTNYWFPCFLIGVVITIDIVIVTTLRYKDSTMGLLNWSIPITITHTLFPAFGYLLFWGLQTTYPELSWAISSMGFIIVLLFVYEMFCEFAQLKPVFAISESVRQWLNAFVRLSKSSVRHGLVVLGLSWDALFSGSGIASAADGWTKSEVVWSFAIVGVVVFACTQTALLVAIWLRSIEYNNVETLIRLTIVGQFAELSVISGFGVLYLSNGFSTVAQNLYVSIVASSAVLLWFFSRHHERIELKARGIAIAAVS